MRVVLSCALFIFGMAFVIPAQGLCVKSNDANLRSGPSSKSGITWVASKHMPLLEVGRKGSWYKVKDVDGKVHWVFSRLVSGSAQCLVVKAGKANLRTGPGTQFPVADYPTANRYFAFEKLDSSNGWYKIRSASGRGPFWIHESLVWRALKVQSISF